MCDFRPWPNPTYNGIPDHEDTTRFYWSLDGESWHAIGGPMYMPYTAPHFTGYRFALFCYATQEPGGHADFDFFRSRLVESRWITAAARTGDADTLLVRRAVTNRSEVVDARLTRLVSIPVTSLAADDETGHIVTGDKGVNRLIENIRWGHRSNYLSIPTDCPQRDERQGWTADTWVFAEAAAYNADVYGFLRKWMADARCRASAGEVRAAWRYRADGGVDYAFSVPQGMAATLELPGEAPVALTSGEWTFSRER